MSAPKRKLTASPAKRRKVTDSTQRDIQSFFVKSPQKETGTSRNASRGIGSLPHESKPETEDDEAIAQRLAAEDGLDVDTTRTLERRWASNAKRDPEASASAVEPEVQVIDVDAEDSEMDTGMCQEREI